ncbi:hypothetical protein K3U93_22095 [Mycobacterium malmoense]|nr:hypothetical protein [Mycobacterium malmoense]QZA17246.1 hypothetical protein K3U93_22095 [Mycobacterium malmoense]UNB94036.1 hypothetical protein H5T25_22070 [Mycobacterium malmoense]
MQQLAALRPLVTAGAAALGASLIALTPTISNNLAAKTQHSTATIQQHAIELTDAVTNPIQTWINTFTTAGVNLQTIYDEWSKIPFMLLQQVAANWVTYTSEYVGAYQAAANDAVSYFLGYGAGDFVPLIDKAFSDIAAGNIATAFSPTLWDALLFFPSIGVLADLESILELPGQAATNFANALTFLGNDAVVTLGEYVLVNPGAEFFKALGSSLQAVSDSWKAGDPLGAVINLVNTPGAVTGGVLNGVSGEYGYLSTTNGWGLLSQLVNTIIPDLSKEIVAPNAPNVAEGGSLATTTQDFISQLINGWPSVQTIFDNLLNLLQTYAGLPSAAAAAATSPAAGSIVGAFNPADVLNGGSAMASLAAELPGLSADVGNIAGHLGADLASVLPGMILSILHF